MLGRIRSWQVVGDKMNAWLDWLSVRANERMQIATGEKVDEAKD